MVEFCPKCGNLLRKKPCPCGYDNLDSTSESKSLLKIWSPPTPNIIYCKITATSLEKLKKMLSKGIRVQKLKEIRDKLKNHFYTCCNCVYYHEEIFHCQLKNKNLRKDSICKSFEPFDNLE
ncbi:MAG: hypothetical protein ACFFBC_05425 [Promethearchaeota archaeon]